ncbi:carboxypeptidase regulatory-like domain-containing protein [Paludisphaera soli]|uniref:carboxypeptidase regulatory-like domain-containing protein n=1 Tax=Paludisphaera soli TaxID=2712865 RepID=UPI0013EB495F|nr:carboxypeptidase regulatory-like domain-containing protein [Paludisphaera soli]
MSDDRSILLLLWLADVSVRWGVLIGLLAIAFAIRPPRSAATRHALCAVVLAAGPALAVVPRWGEAVVPWHWAASATVPDPEPIRSAAPAFAPPRVEPERFQPAILPSPRLDPAPTPAATPQPFDRAGFLARSLVGVWLAGTLAMLARLALGAWTLARWKQSATDLTGDDLAMLAACVADAPGRRGVRMARHPAVASPVVIGGLRPTILVPVDWDAWPPAQRRAGLRHELAHVRRGDDASKLAEELIRCPFWFHPLVAWLLGRIDRERELLCDEAAVALGDDPKGLARLLLELSRRPGPPRRVPSASLPFFPGRLATAVRIERLLEDDMSRTLSRPSFARTWILGPLALAAALGLGGLRVRTATAQDQPRPEPAAPVAGTSSNALRGLVVDPDGKPLVGAAVTIEDARSDAAAKPMRWSLHTDESGRFAWVAPEGMGRILVFVSMPGLAPRSMPLDISWVVARGREIRIALRKLGTLGGILVDAAGNPLEGARVRAMLRSSRDPEQGAADRASAGVYAMNKFTISILIDPSSGLGASREATTAADGSFTLPGDIPSAIYDASLEVRGADGTALSIRRSAPLPPAGSPPTTQIVANGLQTLTPGERPRLTVVPSARIEGRVISEVPGLDLATLSVRVSRSLLRPSAETRPDREGRFVLDGLDESPIDLVLAGPGVHASWTFRPARVDSPAPGATLPVDIRVVRGVEVRGRVVARGSGSPGEGVEVEVWSPSVPDAEALRTVIGEDGRYALRLPAGETILVVSHPGERFVALRADGRNPLSRPAGPFVQFAPTASAVKFTVPEGAQAFEAPPIEVAHAVTLHGRLLAGDGKPIAGAHVSPMSDRPFRSMQGPPPSDDRGYFRFRPGPGTVEVGQEVHLGILRPGVAPRNVRVTPDDEGFVEVVVPDEAPAASEGMKGELNEFIVEPVVTPAGR